MARAPYLTFCLRAKNDPDYWDEAYFFKEKLMDLFNNLLSDYITYDSFESVLLYISK